MPLLRTLSYPLPLALLLAVGACADDASDLSAVPGDGDGTPAPVENPLATASVSIGITCGASGQETVVVITEAEGGCAEHAAVLAGARPEGTSVIVEGSDLVTSMGLEAPAAVCADGVCAGGEIAISLDGLDARVGLGRFAVTFEGQVFEAEFEATRCNFSGDTAPLAADIEVAEVSVYQGTKVRLAEGGVAAARTAPVVAGRPGLLRVFVEPQPSFNSREIEAELSWDRGDGGEAVVRTSKMRVIAASREASLASSFDFELSAEDLAESAKWSVALRETDICASGEPSPRAATPSDGGTLALEPRAIGDLNVVLVPVQYYGDGSGRLPDTSEAQLERYRDAIFSQYPITDVTVSVREPMEWRSYIGPDGSGWSALLQEILLLRSRDGASPTTYYYGIFEPTSTFRSFCNRGCVLGLSPLAGPNEPLYRGAIGIGFSGDTAPGTAVHELGHAHGRPHAPCGVNDSDPDFPYSDGGIGEWGYDVLTGTLKSPGLHSDFMSYCDPTWVSDYTYTALADRIDLVNHTRSAFETSGPPETWRMLSLGEDGATWGGTFETAKPPAGEPVAVEFLDSAGVVLEVGEGAAVRIDHVDSKLISVPPAPDGTAFVRIEGGAVIVY